MFDAGPLHIQMSCGFGSQRVGLHFAGQSQGSAGAAEKAPAGSMSRLLRGYDDDARPLWFRTLL